MSFVLNKMASLLAILVVVGIALFWSSAAQAHTNHVSDVVEASSVVAAPALAGSLTAAENADAVAGPGAENGNEDGHRITWSSCCGTGVSNCMAATATLSDNSIPALEMARHVFARASCVLDGVSLDGLIRPPKPFV
ncbi:hypothetical protein [Aurantimonas sp. HBX-1]|uniref:hypothetical protein n=1 Tax=Aurantimonas sp. HBX-1 TaxID=2906072 RepID=UPI001F30F203|nr:hypothetical protein [Aurantimonas sp. HBX-1]UIJ73430.1 hypothetical protein LXB15_07280 [Aurantimonas sp. HBX-1]